LAKVCIKYSTSDLICDVTSSLADVFEAAIYVKSVLAY